MDHVGLARPIKNEFTQVFRLSRYGTYSKIYKCNSVYDMVTVCIVLARLVRK